MVRLLAVTNRSAGGAQQRAIPRRAKAYVAVVFVVAAALATAAILLVPGNGSFGVGYACVFAVMIALAERLQIRYLHDEHVDALTLVESMFAPLIFIGSGRLVVSVVAAGILLASLIGRHGVLKSAFNVAQWVASASVGALVFHASGAGMAATGANISALVVAMLAVWVMNQTLITGVLWFTSGHPLGTGESRLVWPALVGRGVSFFASTVVGLLVTAAFLWVPWLAPLAMGLLVFLWSAGRAETSVRADRRLLDGLQRATHHLGASLDPAVALPPSLAEARSGFEVREVQLVLTADRGPATTHRYIGGDHGYSVASGPHDLAELLGDSLAGPVRLDATKPAIAAALAAMGAQRGLAAPLQSGNSTIGVLLLLDREGAESFESGELAVSAALARELVGFLERVALVEAIEEERRKLDDIVQHTGDGIVSIEADGTIRSWNAAMQTITGYSAEEMIGTRHFGLLRPRDAQEADLHVAGWVQAYGVGGLPTEVQIVTVDGTTVWLSCSYSQVPARDGGEESLIIVARNITQARELELLKDDFIAVVSHELRTPLVPIKGWAQTLLNRGDRLSDDQRRTAVQSILTQAQRLEALVLNILESSRVEAGQVEARDVVDVAAITDRVVEDVLAAHPDRIIRVEQSDQPCPVRGSTVWVDRALANLVANAVKYSPDDAPVDIVVSNDRHIVSVSVVDHGPGIAEDSQERVFQRFERLEESRKQTGTGLGLYITRRLARAMGGDVTVSSLPGSGSTFVLALPACVDSAPVLPAPRQRTAADQPSSIVRLY